MLVGIVYWLPAPICVHVLLMFQAWGAKSDLDLSFYELSRLKNMLHNLMTGTTWHNAPCEFVQWEL